MHTDSNALLSSALSKRGWALQESILPTCILHFTAEELIWEYNTHRKCECGSRNNHSLVKLTCLPITKARLLIYTGNFGYDTMDEWSRDIVRFLSSRKPKSIYWAWQTIVEYYIQRQLTNHADKLSAVSSLSQVVIESHGISTSVHLAGLWRGSLVRGFLWYVRGPRER